MKTIATPTQPITHAMTIDVPIVLTEATQQVSAKKVSFRMVLGSVLRRRRQELGRTLRDVSAAAQVSLGYLSEIERGQKEASSELLRSICDALGQPQSQVLREVADEMALAELATGLTVGLTAEIAVDLATELAR